MRVGGVIQVTIRRRVIEIKQGRKVRYSLVNREV